MQAGSFLPDVQLDGKSLRDSGGRTTVLVCMHASDCPECRAYLDELAGSASEFTVWDARLVVDRGGAVGAGGAAVVVADRYGQVFHVSEAGQGHALPAARELEEWLKFLGTLCPE